MDYLEFIASKRLSVKPMGFNPVGELNPHLMDWQATVVDWAIRRGRAALFEGCGLGKTVQSLAWAEQVVRYTNKPVMIHCPVGVRQQTKRESEKFEISVPVKVVDKASEVINGINITNYEKLHHFDTSVFSGVVPDESSVLKNYVGKTKRQLIECYAKTPYRLPCTATPAPNDHMELGNHSEFLGVMKSSEMLSRWFLNDTMKAGGYQVKGHAVKDFWEWVASWAVSIDKPSTIGGSDEGYDLPPLTVNRHVVTTGEGNAPEGYLINTAGISATTIHEAKRLTCYDRCVKSAELAMAHDDPTIVWCDTNYEADELIRLMPDAVEIRGNHSEGRKEEMMLAFSNGEISKLITKPTVAGHGMNWQHCNHQVFAGIGFSFELYYQALRRSYRFGQTRPVTIDIVLANNESSIQSTIARKESDHALMQSGMSEAMKLATLAQLGIEKTRDEYIPKTEMRIPSWVV